MVKKNITKNLAEFRDKVYELVTIRKFIIANLIISIYFFIIGWEILMYAFIFNAFILLFIYDKSKRSLDI